MSRIDINCAAEPYNPLPIIDAAFGEVARIRTSSTAPIFILAGERHSQQVETFLPYVAAYRAGLLDGRTLPAHLQGLQFACEHPHDTLKNELEEFREYFPGDLQPDDSPSAQLARILRYYGNGGGDPQNSSRVMFTAFADNNVPLMAIDASIKWGRKFPFLNSKDELTKQFLPTEKPDHHMGFMAGEFRAMQSRNALMAHLLHQYGGHENALTWLNSGHDHLFDNAEHAVSGLAGQLKGHVIIVANATRLENAPDTAATWQGPLITFNHLVDTEQNPEPTTAQVLRSIRQAAP